MTSRILRLILPVFLLASALAPPARSADQEAPLPVLETFVVTGEQPGPALWKVTRKDHTLWILPTYGPLPAGLVWKSRQVEEVIRNSQEVYAQRLIPVQAPDNLKSRVRMLKAVSNIDGKILAEVMPVDLHQRFVQLSERYAGSSAAFERFRPFQASDMLQDAALKTLQLTSDGGVYDTVHRLADRYHVKFLAFETLRSSAWDRMVSDLEKTPRAADMACAAARMDRLESDLRDAVERANAWARGDLSQLRRDVGVLNGGADMAACRQFFQHLKFVRQTLRTLQKKSYSTYERALRKNRSTLVVISIGDLFDADGLLARLRKDGYQIDEP
jgi:uncharacterized protein YbaP (TraB family)